MKNMKLTNKEVRQKRSLRTRQRIHRQKDDYLADLYDTDNFSFDEDDVGDNIKKIVLNLIINQGIIDQGEIYAALSKQGYNMEFVEEALEVRKSLIVIHVTSKDIISIRYQN